MRIRKYAKKISTKFSFAADPSIIPSSYCERENNLQTNVCELNMSPWDMICFSSQSELYYPDDYQEVLLRENRVTKNTIEEEESLESVESIASLKKLPEEVKREKVGLMREKIEMMREKGGSFLCCNRTDGKRWKCSREAKEGDSLCEHHRNLLRSYTTNTARSTTLSRKSDNMKAVRVPRRRNKSNIKVNSSASTEYYYYYYSGYGPSWGKKRRGITTSTTQLKLEDVHEAVDQIQIRNAPLPCHVDDHHRDYVHDDDDDDDGIGTKRRGRKPIKARSLKSLL